MGGPPLDAWLLCATPRSGSTLLCGLLDSSEVAGHPASYFNRHGLHGYATSWRVPQPADGRIDAGYVRAARAAGTTPNGVFGARLMAESRPELLVDLAALTAATPVSDSALLGEHLGRLRFVHLRRLDVEAQAVSWAKALQTHFWHPGEVIEPGAEEPHFDQELIERLVIAIGRFEVEWSGWFEDEGITPHEVTYEQLADDPIATANRVLDFLELEVPAGRELLVEHRRQADEVNAAWIAQYRELQRRRLVEPGDS